MSALDYQRNGLLRKLTCLGLTIDGPRRVQFVFVDEDWRYFLCDNILAFTQEPSGPCISPPRRPNSRNQTLDSLFALCAYGRHQFVLDPSCNECELEARTGRGRYPPRFSRAMLGGIDSGIRIEKGKSCCYQVSGFWYEFDDGKGAQCGEGCTRRVRSRG